jgi:hypothetical protein
MDGFMSCPGRRSHTPDGRTRKYHNTKPAYCTKADQKMIKVNKIQKLLAEVVPISKVQIVLFVQYAG